MPRLTGATMVWLLVTCGVTSMALAQGPSRPRRPMPKPPSGGSGVKVMASEADPNALALAAAPALAKAAADFTAGRKALPPAAAEDVTRLLAGTEEAVQKALGDPELVPLHDRAALAFRRARTALGGAADPAAVERALEPLGQFLDQLATLAAKGPVTVDLCVISKPDPGARASFRPPGSPAAVKTLPATDGTISLVRGLYAYRLEPAAEGKGSKGKAIQCGWEGAASTEPCLDLFDDGKTPLACDFAQGSCARAAGTCS